MRKPSKCAGSENKREMKTEILQPTEESVRTCARYIGRGGVVAFPTETVYGLGADAFMPDAVREIFRIKGRPDDNPLIVHVFSPEQIEDVAQDISPLARKLMQSFMPGALTLVLKKKKGVPDCVTAGLPTVGVRMPSHPVCRKFLRACVRPICAPSANTSTKPSPTTAMHVWNDLNGKIPYVLDGGSCEIGLESTILDVSSDVPKLLRQGGIPKEELERVCGMSVPVQAGGTVALCPGMKYKHYAPKADVLFSAYYASMVATIAKRYDMLVLQGKNPVILCLHANAEKYGARHIFDMGENYDSYAGKLFACLRQADDEKFDTVIAEGVSSDGIGAAIINRLVKSSGGKII